MGSRRPRFVPLIQLMQRTRPDVTDPFAEIEARTVIVSGRIITNPRAMVPADAALVIRRQRSLRGEAKVEAALDVFGIRVKERCCLDLGAAAGGFTRVLLRRGASRVFAVDAGYGQLRADVLGDHRVVNLERTNIADLGRALPTGTRIDLVTMDLSYLSVADAVPQIDDVHCAPDADLVALVKPMFELHMARPPSDEEQLRDALRLAVNGTQTAGAWKVVGQHPSPVVGSKGASEWLIHGRRSR